MADTYRIVRFYSDKREPKFIKRHVSLDEAKRHCGSEHTEGVIKRRGGHVVRWFDGYVKE